jgi:acyl-CoA thioester hydrolase
MPGPYREVIDPAWTDYNGHLNVAYYALVFDRATDCFLDGIGIGARYAAATRASTFVVEAHTTYLQEVHAEAVVLVKTRLVAFDRKRMHYVHQMLLEQGDETVAMQEQLSVHVDLKTRRSAAWPETILALLGALAASDTQAGLPAGIGRSISLRG